MLEVDGVILNKLIIYVGVGGWLFATALRFLITYYSWPRDRWVRLLYAIGHAAMLAFFAWRAFYDPTLKDSALMLHDLDEQLWRDSTNIFLMLGSVLESMFAVAGLTKARAKILSEQRKEEQGIIDSR